MPNIRDVVHALGTRDGVDAVIVLGRDGLTIDALAKDGLDTDGLAALIPSVVAACNRLGTAAERGAFGTGVVEYHGGLALVAEVTAEALLAILFQPNTNIGSLLYDLRKHREAIAALL